MRLQGLETNGSSTQGLHLRAECHIEVGNLVAAERDYARILHRNPTDGALAMAVGRNGGVWDRG